VERHRFCYFGTSWQVSWSTSGMPDIHLKHFLRYSYIVSIMVVNIYLPRKWRTISSYMYAI
jgi:hypothetical protein